MSDEKQAPKSRLAAVIPKAIDLLRSRARAKPVGSLTIDAATGSFEWIVVTSSNVVTRSLWFSLSVTDRRLLWNEDVEQARQYALMLVSNYQFKHGTTNLSATKLTDMAEELLRIANTQRPNTYRCSDDEASNGA